MNIWTCAKCGKELKSGIVITSNKMICSDCFFGKKKEIKK